MAWPPWKIIMIDPICLQLIFWYRDGFLSNAEYQRLYDEHRDKELAEILQNGFSTLYV